MKQRLRRGRNRKLIRRTEAAAPAREMTYMNMKSKWITVALALAFSVGTTLAHGNKVHVMGKVEKVSADSLQVKTRDGKSVEVKLVASTVYIQRMAVKPSEPSVTNADRPAKLADLAVGDTVVIHATPKGGTLEADEVKFSAGLNKVASTGARPKS